MNTKCHRSVSLGTRARPILTRSIALFVPKEGLVFTRRRASESAGSRTTPCSSIHQNASSGVLPVGHCKQATSRRRPQLDVVQRAGVCRQSARACTGFGDIPERQGPTTLPAAVPGSRDELSRRLPGLAAAKPTTASRCRRRLHPHRRVRRNLDHRTDVVDSGRLDRSALPTAIPIRWESCRFATSLLHTLSK